MGSMKFNANPLEQSETLREQHLHSKKKITTDSKAWNTLKRVDSFVKNSRTGRRLKTPTWMKISRGLQTLKRLGADMDEEMARQQPAIENIDFFK